MCVFHKIHERMTIRVDLDQTAPPGKIWYGFTQFAYAVVSEKSEYVLGQLSYPVIYKQTIGKCKHLDLHQYHTRTIYQGVTYTPSTPTTSKKSLTLTSRSLRRPEYASMKFFDRYVIVQVRTKSFQELRKYDLLETLIQNFNRL